MLGQRHAQPGKEASGRKIYAAATAAERASLSLKVLEVGAGRIGPESTHGRRECTFRTSALVEAAGGGNQGCP